MNRAEIDTDDLLKVVLLLVVVWLLLEIVGAVLDIAFWLLDAIPTLIGVALVVLIALHLTDRI
ncbi:hypothetical protein C465_15352 [Halorubrum distributum JCM 9100]|uniref:Uncharacterized protein n=6 Tax=Halorubrum distributum TaxID=29283 RepID=M0EF43_9EURY|nr:MULTISPECIES: hypothetical protein [Halorubrum distributum group]PHQ44255.1 hypothetical protein DJ68_19495 [Halorubrum sp. C3]ELZ31239.1 hypothetical protein C473_11646 [Halorubrum terrestre JCM 10247]ELZ45009.1 hypothetical protein C465_15352 [Halorubrum distributum JCM 9100]ELZ51007.1 hypothetical protein C466_13839 [Halorubrum distributum JCM 10118]EMA60481.1 hypothetical protein C470_09215 [Halorubrum litoreum JCM 13561]